MKENGLWKTIWKFAGEYKKNLILSVIFSFITGVCVSLQPIVIKYVIDEGISKATLINSDKLKAAAIFCVAYIIVSAVRVISWSFGYKNALKGLEGFLFNIRSTFFNHIQNLCMRFYDTTSSGELFNYIMGTPMNNLKNFLSQFSLAIPYQLISLVISLIAMLKYDWLLTVVMLFVIIVSLFFNITSRKKVRRLSGDLLKSESEASKYIDDVLHGSDAVKLYAIEDDINIVFENRLEDLKLKGINLTFSQWIINAKTEMTQHIGTALIYFVGAISCIYRGLSVGELTAFVGSMSIIMTTLGAFFGINIIRSSAQASLDRINTILEEKTSTPEISSNCSIEIEKERAMRSNLPCIDVKDITFAYDKKNIFSDFSCKMEYNKSYGLVGSSGSGKSTITKLLMRLYEIDGGEILFHGCDIKKFSLHDLRKNIGIVPQSPFIFQMSIIENIKISCPDATMPEILKAMEIARVHEFVNELPKGWNTVVGEGGYGLSGGQKQRIAIARAVLGNPDILIFDEATSALDNVSERHIQAAIDDLMKSHTIIIIAHRLTTVKNVDDIYVFDKGKIVQEGSFDKLKSEEGLFKEMLGESEE